MAHRLALDLTQDRAVLLAETDGGGWFPLGDTDLTGRDLQQRLAQLLARGLDPDDASVVPALLVSLPADQMTYASLPAPPQGVDRASALRDELVRLYPHLAPDPHLDWRAHGPWYQVAAAPRAVLQEATEFLTACGLVPTAFTARPEPAQFAGQPDLGHLGAPDPGLRPWPKLPDPSTAVAAPRPDPSDKIAAARARATEAARRDPSFSLPLEDGDDGPATTPLRGLRGRRIAMGRKTRWLAAMTGLLVAGLASVALWPGLLGPGAPDGPAIVSPPVFGEAPAPVAGPADRMARPEMLAIDDSEAADDEAFEDLASAAETPEMPDLPRQPSPVPDTPAAFFSAPPVLTQTVADATLDDLLLPGIDETSTTDALALPDMVAWQELPQPDAPASPGPAAQVYVIDERGLVKPSRAGTPNPDGVMIFAGAPPAKTRPRPEQDPDAVLLRVVSRADLPASDPLHRLAPRHRPDTLTEQFERANLGGKTEAELQLFNPQQRPVSQQQLATEAAQAAPGPAATAIADAPRPVPRSDQAAARFAKARSAAPPQTLAAADIAAPTKPSPAKVAREATDSSGIDLNSLNLLGTFGPRSKSRALVRLPSGQVVNVAVGDRMDGGRVAEITQGRLRYVKSGRNISLTMPRG
ncbi:MAG: hypothetical protein KDA50_12825 [Rhodobacteraceae bacterium]|nr:hypothetical protein [Paracoccaceae bacterium]